MASLSNEDILDRIARPRNKRYLDLAVFQEERLIFHGEAILEKYNLPWTAFFNFTVWWKGLISQPKHIRIEQLMGCPLYTPSIVKDIFDSLQKFIDAQDRYVSFQFENVDYTNDYNAFLNSQNDDTFWRQNVLKELKTGICSYVIIDLPANQTGVRPEPYNYFISPRLVCDVDINKFTDKVEYIIFKQSNFFWDPEFQSTIASRFMSIAENTEIEKIIAIDDKYYRTYIKKAASNPGENALKSYDASYLVGSLGNWELISEKPHSLGYCPAIDFWKDSIKGTNGINKLGPITLQLSQLDYIQFYKACIDYMNLYGPFPVAITYDFEEKEFDDKTKELNTGELTGYDQSRLNTIANSPNTQDPRTSGRDMIGPGTKLSHEAPNREGEFDIMKQVPLAFVGMPPESVKLANEILEGLESCIIEKCTGRDEDYLNEIAKNAEMIAASFRKEETILTWIKTNVERIHEFVTNAKCILRYGEDYYKGCDINYGRDYLLKDATTLTSEFKDSVEAGMPQSYSYEIALTAITTRFKNNPEKLARFKILLDLEPYPTINWADFQLLTINTGDETNFIIKANFISFVARFEQENGSIVNFGSLIPYSQKISLIKSKFSEYATEIKWVKPISEQPKQVSNSGVA